MFLLNLFILKDSLFFYENMRIPLQVRDFAGGLRVMAQFLIRSDKPHLFGSIESIVDTGSPTTILGMPDMKRMRVSQLQLKNLESRKEPHAYGGGQLKTKILRDARLKFGEFFECVMDVQIPVDEITECTQPTILGVDFMEKNKLRLVFDPDKREAYFEN